MYHIYICIYTESTSSHSSDSLVAQLREAWAQRVARGGLGQAWQQALQLMGSDETGEASQQFSQQKMDGFIYGNGGAGILALSMDDGYPQDG